jgi:hypothetical protein
VYGRIQGQKTYQLIDTVIGTSNKLIDVGLFDFLDLEVISYDTLSNYVDIAGSGFVTAGTSGSVSSSVTVTNFPNPQNVAVVNTPNVITDLAASTPIISNLTLSTAGTEYSLVLPTNTKKIMIKVRGYSAVFTLGYVSAGNYITIPRGCNYSEDTVLMQSANRTLYFKGSVNNVVLEIISWV